MIDASPDTGTTGKSYHEALGLFIEEFATTEGLVRMLLWHYARVSPMIGRAVFPGTQVDRTIKLIKDIMFVQNPGEPRKSDLEVMLHQLNCINRIRNNIVHYIPLSGVPGDVRHLTNEMRALTEKHRREVEVSPAMLAQMTDDLRKIQVHVWYHLCFDRIPKSAMGFFDEVWRTPWRHRDTAVKRALDRSEPS